MVANPTLGTEKKKSTSIPRVSIKFHDAFLTGSGPTNRTVFIVMCAGARAMSRSIAPYDFYAISSSDGKLEVHSHSIRIHRFGRVQTVAFFSWVFLPAKAGQFGNEDNKQSRRLARVKQMLYQVLKFISVGVNKGARSVQAVFR